MPSSQSPSLFLTNYRGGGIGDFGASLGSHLNIRLGKLKIEETSISGRGSIQQSVFVAKYEGNIIANLGLTAWGRSGVRNFSGFAALGMHQALGRRTISIVHHAIEILDATETGYSIPVALRYGAHLALRTLSRCDLVVFSPRLKDLLMRSYSARSVWLVPLPGEQARIVARLQFGGKPKIVNVGYWAPYKGIDIFLGVAEKLRPIADFFLVGSPHAVLSRDIKFGQEVERWRGSAKRLGVRMPGFLPTDQLDTAFSEDSVGVLPYTSASGASAAFQVFADRGIPVVASDLPEFRYLAEQGAGILLAQPTVESISGAVLSLLSDSEAWAKLARKQLSFTQRYSWIKFVDQLVTRYGLDSNLMRET